MAGLNVGTGLPAQITSDKERDMKTLVMTGLLAIALLGPVAHAVDTETTPVANAENRDYLAGRQAVNRKDSPAAVASFARRWPLNRTTPTATTCSGFRCAGPARWTKRSPPTTRPWRSTRNTWRALEYSGIAYLKAGQPDKAKAQLVRLDSAGGNAPGVSDLNAPSATTTPANASRRDPAQG